jgi:isoleucyl-tRNA synthetase
LAPFLVFTAEEAWSYAHPGQSVHLEQFPVLPENWNNQDLADKWAQIRIFRKEVTESMEVERKAKTIGSSLEAAPLLTLPAEWFAKLSDVDWAEICVTSNLKIVQGASVHARFHLAEGDKCPRCWKVLPEVTTQGVCDRCHSAVNS